MRTQHIEILQYISIIAIYCNIFCNTIIGLLIFCNTIIGLLTFCNKIIGLSTFCNTIIGKSSPIYCNRLRDKPVHNLQKHVVFLILIWHLHLPSRMITSLILTLNCLYLKHCKVVLSSLINEKVDL